MDPKWRQDGAKMPLCWLMLALLGAILAHLGALGLHLVAKLSQDGAKMAQHSAQMSHQTHLNLPKSLNSIPQIDPKSVYLYLSISIYLSFYLSV